MARMREGLKPTAASLYGSAESSRPGPQHRRNLDGLAKASPRTGVEAGRSGRLAPAATLAYPAKGARGLARRDATVIAIQP